MVSRFSYQLLEAHKAFFDRAGLMKRMVNAGVTAEDALEAAEGYHRAALRNHGVEFEDVRARAQFGGAAQFLRELASRLTSGGG